MYSPAMFQRRLGPLARRPAHARPGNNRPRSGPAPETRAAEISRLWCSRSAVVAMPRFTRVMDTGQGLADLGIIVRQ